MKAYTRSHSWHQATVRLPDRTTSAAYGTWRRRVRAWERREQYRALYWGQPRAGTESGMRRAAHNMGVSYRTIQRWRAIIRDGQHTEPGPWQSPS